MRPAGSSILVSPMGRCPCRGRWTLLVALLAAGCMPEPTNELQRTDAMGLDYNGFVCDALPVLVRDCSYLACHGANDHALRIYSAGKLRLSDVATRAQRDAPLTADELQRNFDSAAGMVAAATAAQRQAGTLAVLPLLEKPLQARFGGAEHAGVGIFPSYPAMTLADDPEWTALTAWVGGQAQPSPPAQRCEALFLALGQRPRSP